MSNVIVRPDAKGRINLGTIAENVSSYKVTIDDNGNVILEPYIEIPFSEKWIFDDQDLLEKVKKHLRKEQIQA